MNIKFLFLLFVILHHVNMHILNASASDDEEFLRQSYLQLNVLLAESKPRILIVKNSTGAPITLRMEEIYHRQFTEEDFSTNRDVMVTFHSRYQVLSVAGDTRKRLLPQAFIKPYRVESPENAIRLASSRIISSQEIETIETTRGAHISKISCEPPEKYIYATLSEDKIKLFISNDRLAHTVLSENYAKNLYELAMPRVPSVPFATWFFSTVFPEHALKGQQKSLQTKENFYQKIQRTHQLGSEKIANSALTFFLSPQIPLVTHTFFPTRNTPLLNENQKRWFERSIQTLPKEKGWKHYIWVSVDPDTIKFEDLGGVYGDVEIKNIGELTGVQNHINKLIQNFPQEAAAILKYSALMQYGGVTRSVDTEIIQDITVFNMMFGFYAGLEMESTLMVDSKILGAESQHPTIARALDLAIYHTQAHIENSFNTENLALQRTAPQYLQKINKLSNDQKYHFKYGNGILSIAFHQCGLAKRDMIFDPEVFSPKKKPLTLTPSDASQFLLRPETHVISYVEGLS